MVNILPRAVPRGSQTQCYTQVPVVPPRSLVLRWVTMLLYYGTHHYLCGRYRKVMLHIRTALSAHCLNAFARSLLEQWKKYFWIRRSGSCTCSVKHVHPQQIDCSTGQSLQSPAPRAQEPAAPTGPFPTDSNWKEWAKQMGSTARTMTKQTQKARPRRWAF